MDETNNGLWTRIKEFFGTMFTAGCLGTTCLGCLAALIVPVVLYFSFAAWFCHIQPDVTYTWYSGIWHGVFIIPNWIMGLFNDSILCKAQNYTIGYNIWWWIMLITEILSIILGGGSRRS